MANIKRLYYIDFLNVLACFAVVCLHCSGHVFNFAFNKVWILSMMVQAAFHFAIPIFFMITGATLLGYREKYTTKEFFIKRFKRIVIPFAIWTVIYTISSVNMDFSKLKNVSVWTNSFFNNGATGIFWFFYSIIAVYLCMPVFSLIAKKTNRKVIQYIILIWFITVSVIPVFERITGVVVTDMIKPIIGLEYTGYVFMGWYINNFEISKKSKSVIYIMGILSLISMPVMTFLISRKTGELDTFIMRYFSPECVFMGASIFLLFKNIDFEKFCNNHKGFYKVISNLSSLSYGVYLVHILIITYLPVIITKINVGSGWFIIYGPLLIYALSCLIVFCIKKIPLVKRIIP